MAEKEKGYAVLVVDDEEHLCRLVSRWVIEAGYLCKTANSGKEAIELLEKYAFSLVITDIMMPDINGIEVLKHVNRTCEYTPVIMMTGIEDQLTIKQAYAFGAYGYMNKPLNQNEVLSNILNAMRRRKLEIENKRYSESLEKLIDARTKEIEGALASISDIMKRVVEEGDFELRYENPKIPECYVEMNCGKEDCPCYGKGRTRCWQIAGTYCGGQIQGRFAEKYEKCSECPVFKKATDEYGLEIGEHFNNMMDMLASKHYDLQSSYDQLKSSQKQLVQQEKMATIGQLSAGIAHEINNPVGYVSSNMTAVQKYFAKLKEFIDLQTDAIKGCDQGGDRIEIGAERKRLKIDFILNDIEDLFRESVEGCDRIRSIISDLKSFARNDEDRHERVNINEVIDKTINVVWNEIKYKAKIEKNYGDLPDLNCYPHKISQVFMNLLVNASHAIAEQGVITITTRHDAGSIFVSVHDSGCGIKEENLENIFDAFFTTKEEGKGTGLGLSICKDIVENHDGEITVASKLGEGTTFTVRIPVV